MSENSDRPVVGLYFYGWYDHAKWTSHRFPRTPEVGFYRSGDPLLARWQVEQIARTGVDFVAFEMVPHTDHSFEQICTHARNCIPLLAEHGIGYAMFIDMAIFQLLADPIRLYAETLERLDAEGWLKGSFDSAAMGKALHHFAPRPANVAELRQLTPEGMSWWACTWQPGWGRVRLDDYPVAVQAILAPDWADALARDLTLKDSLEALGYFAFWTHNEDMPVMNGVAAVASGYNDLMLRRDPQLAQPLPHRDGQTLETQFRHAQDHAAHTLMIYGWNEYFEDAVIEPTLEHGDFYLRLTAHFISQIKTGQPISWPEGLTKPAPVRPRYLSAALENRAQLHADGVPRWDMDDYHAEIAQPLSWTANGAEAVFEQVQVVNTGILPWAIATADAEIALGVRLRTAGGEVVREGRAALGGDDVVPGDTRTVAIRVKLTGLPVGAYRADLGVVWEHRFWFPDPATSIEITLSATGR